METIQALEIAPQADVPAAELLPWRPAPLGGGKRAAREPEIARVKCPIDIDFYIVPGTGGHGRARADALLAVIGAFGCRVAVHGYDASRTDTFLVMTGTQAALDALGLLLPEIAVRMERAAWAAASGYATKVRAAMPGMSGGARRRALVTPYFRDYLRGYGSGIAERVRALRADQIKTEGPELARIIANDSERTRRRFAERFPAQQMLRKERVGLQRARRAGAAAARAAGITDDYLAIHDLVFAML